MEDKAHGLIKKQMSRDKPVLAKLLVDMINRLMRQGVAGLIFKEVRNMEGSINKKVMVTVGHKTG